jgi:hypothetical protein
MRWSEVAGLIAGDLDALRGTIRVSAQFGRDRERHTPKSAAPEYARWPTPAWLLDLVVGQHAARGLDARQSDALLFVNRSGGPLNYTVDVKTTLVRRISLKRLRERD